MARYRSANWSLETQFRERFTVIFDVDEPDGSCIAPLIAGVDECPHGSPRSDIYQQTPPHLPPHGDHCELWLRDDEPGAFSMHIHDLERDVLADCLVFADSYGLEVRITATSWHDPHQCVCVVFYPPEWRPEY